MKAFLDSVAAYLLETHGKGLSETCMVFPNRRSGLFFNRYLSARTPQTMWAPRVITINELMQELSGLETADPLDILFELYGLYRNQTGSPETFDEFYHWGEVMVSDFDTIDKYLVDAGMLFSNITDLKEIDERFGGLEPEQVEFIRRFWEHFHIGGESREKELFLSTWKMLPTLYRQLRQSLEQTGTGYEGMIYRQVAETGMERLDEKLKNSRYIFVGFNALSNAERRLMRKMQKKGVATFFWDYDVHYIRDEKTEAGRFIRENLAEFPPPEDLQEFSNLDRQRSIRIFDLPTDILQAKTVHRILSRRQEPIEEVNDTAIIACDEELLMPLIVSLPEQVEKVNITMGYPFHHTPLFSMVDQVLGMQVNARRQETGKVRFYYRDVLSVLNHHYYKMIAGEEAQDLRGKIIRENRIYLEPSFFRGDLAGRIFQPVSDVDELCVSLTGLLRVILDLLTRGGKGMHAALEREYVLVMLKRINKLQELGRKQELLTFQTFIRLFRKILFSERVPFTGEPLAGLQVMGILETRLLDFDHLIMVSVNEDIMPRASAGQSFIPYSMRYAYQMPTREDMDAIYAYYYYRLIQRARRVDLLFNSSSEGVKSGEMSRYLYQALYFYGAELIRPVLPVRTVRKEELTVQKDQSVLETLKCFRNDHPGEWYLSPSALNAYIECPLKFYLRFVNRIHPPDEVLEELDPIGLGNIVHNAIHELYKGLMKNRRQVERQDLEHLLKDPATGELLLDIFRKEYFRSTAPRKLEGRNLVIFEITRRYLEQILRIDRDIAPFELVELEEKHSATLEVSFAGDEPAAIRLGGKIDRVDKLSGVVRVIDYKTGLAEQTFASVPALFDHDEKNRSKEGFQALLYAWLYDKQDGQDQLKPGLYVLRNMFGKNPDPYFQLGTNKQDRVPVEDFQPLKEEFEHHLSHLLKEIFDPAVPFYQTSITSRCEICDYKSLCQRD